LLSNVAEQTTQANEDYLVVAEPPDHPQQVHISPSIPNHFSTTLIHFSTSLNHFSGRPNHFSGRLNHFSTRPTNFHPAATTFHLSFDFLAIVNERGFGTAGALCHQLRAAFSSVAGAQNEMDAPSGRSC
jgi:hypothetical protein